MSSTSIMRRDGSTVTVVNGEHSTSIIDNSTGQVIGLDDQSAIGLARAILDAGSLHVRIDARRVGPLIRADVTPPAEAGVGPFAVWGLSRGSICRRVADRVQTAVAVREGRSE